MKFLRRLWPLTLLVVLVLAGGGLWLNHDQLLDWAAARRYKPSPTVSELVTDTSMTPYARRLFYANRPVVEGKQTFNGHCTDPSEQVAVLGCFTGNRMGIYLYDVTDERLHGIEQVTAAHEMLHQAFQRLDAGERTRISGLLQEYHDLKASQALKDKIAGYQDSEPGELLNEMHSIFGTEANDLPPELETYYAQYFTSRQKVLAFHDQYQSEFDKRRAQIADYDGQLASLKSQIESNKVELKAQEATLTQRRTQLDGYLAANRIDAYNAAVPSFNALVITYRKDLKHINDLVDQFNSLLATRNALAVQERQLEAAIDSSVHAASQQ
jgi:hypothetical protein